jgi:hypothetical protein
MMLQQDGLTIGSQLPTLYATGPFQRTPYIKEPLMSLRDHPNVVNPKKKKRVAIVIANRASTTTGLARGLLVGRADASSISLRGPQDSWGCRTWICS